MFSIEFKDIICLLFSYISLKEKIIYSTLNIFTNTITKKILYKYYDFDKKIKNHDLNIYIESIKTEDIEIFSVFIKVKLQQTTLYNQYLMLSNLANTKLEFYKYVMNSLIKENKVIIRFNIELINILINHNKYEYVDYMIDIIFEQEKPVYIYDTVDTIIKILLLSNEKYVDMIIDKTNKLKQNLYISNYVFNELCYEKKQKLIKSKYIDIY